MIGYEKHEFSPEQLKKPEDPNQYPVDIDLTRTLARLANRERDEWAAPKKPE